MSNLIYPLLLPEPPFFTMARKSNPTVPLQNSTHGEAPIREFTNSNLTPEQLRQRAATLLNSNELLRDVQSLTPEDQAKFIDKVDQVCRDDRLSSLNITIHYFCKGISDDRLARRGIRNRIGGRVQRS